MLSAISLFVNSISDVSHVNVTVKKKAFGRIGNGDAFGCQSQFPSSVSNNHSSRFQVLNFNRVFLRDSHPYPQDSVSAYFLCLFPADTRVPQMIIGTR